MGIEKKHILPLMATLIADDGSGEERTLFPPSFVKTNIIGIHNSFHKIFE